MKKITLLISIIALSFSGFSQNNLVKAHPIGFAFNQLSLSYERVVADYNSVMINFSYTMEKEMGFKDYLISTSGQEEGLATTIYKEISIKGMSVTPEFRIYTSSEREAPKGFYFAPFLSYSSFSVVGDFLYDDPLEDVVDYNLSGNYTAFGGGISLGYQWVIADFLAIDLQFLPLGVGFGKAELDVIAVGYDDRLYDEIKDDVEGDYGLIQTELQDISDTEVKLIAKTLVPVLNFGVKIGVVF